MATDWKAEAQMWKEQFHTADAKAKKAEETLAAVHDALPTRKQMALLEISKPVRDALVNVHNLLERWRNDSR